MSKPKFYHELITLMVLAPPFPIYYFCLSRQVSVDTTSEFLWSCFCARTWLFELLVDSVLKLTLVSLLPSF